MMSRRLWTRDLRRDCAPDHHTNPNTPHFWDWKESSSRMMRSNSVPRDLGNYSYQNTQQPWPSNSDYNQNASNWNNGWQQGYRQVGWEEGERRGRNYLEGQYQGRFHRDNHPRSRGYKYRNRDYRHRNQVRGGPPYQGRDLRSGSAPRELEGHNPDQCRLEDGNLPQERRVQVFKVYPGQQRVENNERSSVTQPRLHHDDHGANLPQQSTVTTQSSIPHARVTSLAVEGDLENKKDSGSQMSSERIIAPMKMEGWSVKQKVIMNGLQIEEYDKCELGTIPDVHDPNIAIGGSLVVPEIFYFCSACKVYLKQNVNKHLRGIIHFNNIKHGDGVFSDVSCGEDSTSDVDCTSGVNEEKPAGKEPASQTLPPCPLDPLQPTSISPTEHMDGVFSDVSCGEDSTSDVDCTSDVNEEKPAGREPASQTLPPCPLDPLQPTSIPPTEHMELDTAWSEDPELTALEDFLDFD